MGTGSSPVNSLLCKKQGKAAYNTPIMVGPLPGPCVCESFSAPGCPCPYCNFYSESVLLNAFQLILQKLWNADGRPNKHVVGRCPESHSLFSTNRRRIHHNSSFKTVEQNLALSSGSQLQ